MTAVTATIHCYSNALCPLRTLFALQLESCMNRNFREKVLPNIWNAFKEKQKKTFKSLFIQIIVLMCLVWLSTYKWFYNRFGKTGVHSFPHGIVQVIDNFLATIVQSRPVRSPRLALHLIYEYDIRVLVCVCVAECEWVSVRVWLKASWKKVPILYRPKYSVHATGAHMIFNIVLCVCMCMCVYVSECRLSPSIWFALVSGIWWICCLR